MKKHLFISFLLLSLSILSRIGHAQTTVNPDLSFIGDMRMVVHRQAPADISDNKLKFDFHELEIVAGGYLNPYARADVTMGLTKGGIDIEEAYATLLKGLPWNLQIKAGQYLVDVGGINTQHTHQWSWIERPLMFKLFFGEEGLKAVGLNVTSLVPAGPNAITISGNVFTGGSYWGESGDAADAGLTGSARVSFFMPLTDHASLELGCSGLSRRGDSEKKTRMTLGDFDFKYKWRPDMYHSLVIVAEAMIGSRELNETDPTNGAPKKITPSGAFAAIDYQFKRQYNAGGFIDYCRDPSGENGHQLGFGLFGGFSLVEETYRIGVILRQDQGSALGRPYQTIMVQLLWSLGPHKPHQF
jgi:hypothetical protein